MTYIAVTLFDHPDDASEGMHALRENGFSPSDIEYIESDPESQNFFRRVFTREGGEEFEADRSHDILMDMGVEEKDAKRYAKKVKKGHSLVITRCTTRDEAERASRILDEYPFGRDEEKEPATSPEHLGADRTGQPKQPGFTGSPGVAHTEGEYDVESAGHPERSEAGRKGEATRPGAGDEVEPPMGATQPEEREPQEEYVQPAGFADISEEERRERGAVESENGRSEGEFADRSAAETEGEFVEPMGTEGEFVDTGEPGTESDFVGTSGADSVESTIGLDEESMPIEEMTTRAKRRFEEYEQDCRDHYERYLVDDGIDFNDYIRAYRFGMALGEDANLTAYEWETIEPEAGRQWELQEATSWENHREAARFGWYLVRGQGDEYERRSPKGIQ